MKHLISLFVTLAATWWLLSGHTSGLLLGLGLASVLLTLWICERMDVIDHESHPVHVSLGLVRFWIYLAWEIVVSNVQLVRIILSPRPPIDPSVITVPTRQVCDLGKVVLGNAITLTPGTVTLDVGGGQIVVHALTPATAADVKNGVMDQRVPLDIEEGV